MTFINILEADSRQQSSRSHAGHDIPINEWKQNWIWWFLSRRETGAVTHWARRRPNSLRLRSYGPALMSYWICIESSDFFVFKVFKLADPCYCKCANCCTNKPDCGCLWCKLTQTYFARPWLWVYCTMSEGFGWACCSGQESFCFCCCCFKSSASVWNQFFFFWK